MKDCLHSYMKVGIVPSQAFLIPSPRPEIAAAIKMIAEDEFFGGIDINPVPREIWDDVINVLKSSRLVVGLNASTVLWQKLDINSPDHQERKAAVSAIKSLVDEAYLLGASRLYFYSGPAPADKNMERAKKLLVDSLLQICDYAEKKGKLIIVLKVMDRDVDRLCLIGPTEEAVQIATEVRKHHNNFGLDMDLSHLPLLGESSEHAVKTAKDCIVYTHIGNCLISDKSNPLYGDKHPPFGIPGGANDVDELRLFLKALLDIGYIGAGKQNVVAYEVRPLDGQIPEVIIANSKRILMEAWASL